MAKPTSPEVHPFCAAAPGWCGLHLLAGRCMLHAARLVRTWLAVVRDETLIRALRAGAPLALVYYRSMKASRRGLWVGRVRFITAVITCD